MINELLMASQSVQALTTLLKAANQLSNYNEIVLAVSEVNSKLLQANTVALASQEKQSLLTSRIQELEQEIAHLKNWETESKGFELTEYSTGLFTYITSGNTLPLKSSHKYCANCFNKKIKSILQQQFVAVGRQLSLVCHGCNTNVIFRHYKDET